MFFAMALGQIPVAPPWVQAIQANLDQQFANVNRQLVNVNQQLVDITNVLTNLQNEKTILLANSQAGNQEPLYDPTNPGWTLLVPPHPTTRDELFVFTGEFLTENLLSILTILHRGTMYCVCCCIGPPAFTTRHPSCCAQKADCSQIRCETLIDHLPR